MAFAHRARSRRCSRIARAATERVQDRSLARRILRAARGPCARASLQGVNAAPAIARMGQRESLSS
jgi:hypothetical protein